MAVGERIEEGEYYDITLTVDNVQWKDESNDVEYFAWCKDRNGQTVPVTVFSDNTPDVSIEEGEQYRFEEVEGERWDNGTPGVIVRPWTTITRVIDGREGGTEPPDSTGLVIDSLSQLDHDTDESVRELKWWLRFPLSVSSRSRLLLAGAPTAAVLGVSLFTQGMGIASKVIIVGGGWLAAAVATYLTHYKPNSKLKQRRQTKHVTLFLETLLRDVTSLIGERRVRANVMWASDDGLSVFAHTEGYRPIELDQTYEPGQGPCGRAYQNGEAVVYDASVRPHAEADMTDAQREVTDSVESCLSIPIFPTDRTEGDPIAVLNLDSTAPIGETRFDDDEVKALCRRYADLIGDVLD